MSLSAVSEGERDSLVGTQVAGRYLIERVHSRGGMSVVYAAQHVQQQREVAIKVLDPESAADPQAVERFLEEAQTASSLSHGHVVGVTEFGRLPDGRPYLVMPMIAGTDMATLLSQEGPQPPRRVATLLAGVASALDAMHEKGLVHRDIKSENLMHIRGEDGTETVLLLDFGISAARQREQGSAGEDGGGTPEFMAPEALAGHLSDHRGDVYSLATVAFELMSGSLPFEGEDLTTLLQNKASGKRRSLAEAAGCSFAPSVEAVLARGLAHDPAERQRSAGELLRELQAATADAVEETTQVRPHKRRRHLPSRTLHGRAGGQAGGKRTTHRSWNPKPAADAGEAVTAEIPKLPAGAQTLPGFAAVTPELLFARATEEASKQAPEVASTSPETGASEASKPAVRGPATLLEIRARVEALGKPAAPPISAPPPAAGATASQGLAGLFDGIDVPGPRDEPLVFESGSHPAVQAGPGDSLRPPEIGLDDALAFQSQRRGPGWPAYAAVAAAVVVVLALWGRSGQDEATSEPAAEPAREPESPAAAAAPQPEPPPPQPAPSLQAPIPEPALGAPPTPPIEPAARALAAEPPAALAAPEPAEPPPSATRTRKSASARARKTKEPKEAATRPAPAEREPLSEAKPERASAPELTQQGTEAMLRGDFAAASAAFQRAIQADSRHAPAYRGKGLVLERMNRSKEAVRAFKQFLKLAPDAPGADKIRARLEALESGE